MKYNTLVLALFCVYTPNPPLIPEEPTQAVKKAKLWGAKTKGVGYNLSAQLLPPHAFPVSVEHWKRPLFPHESQGHQKKALLKLKVNTLISLFWQPTCFKSRKLKQMVVHVSKSRWGKFAGWGDVDVLRKLWCHLGVSECIWASTKPINSMSHKSFTVQVGGWYMRRITFHTQIVITKKIVRNYWMTLNFKC